MLSRTADSLFWLSRYVERADNTARIIDAASRLDGAPGLLCRHLERMGVGARRRRRAPRLLSRATTTPSATPSSISSPSRRRTRRASGPASKPRAHNGRAVRTALTMEMWEAINAGWLELKRYDGARMDRPTLNEFLGRVKEACLRFDGSAYRTMLRNDVYYFSRLGVYLERADNTARILDVKYHVLLPETASVGGGLDYFQWSSILRSVSALTAYRWVYRESLKPWLIADLLVLNEQMPRSLASCYENLTAYLDELARAYGRQGPAQRTARIIRTRLQNAEISDIFQQERACTNS